MTDTAGQDGGQVADTGGHEPATLSWAEAVALTGLSERTLRRRAAAGELRQSRIGRRAALDRGDVLDLAAKLGRRPADTADGGQVADSAGQVPDAAGQALAPLLADELAALRRQNEGLHGLVMDLNRRLDEGRKLLTAGDTEAARELTELRAAVVEARTARRWAVLLAAVLAVASVALAVALVAVALR